MRAFWNLLFAVSASAQVEFASPLKYVLTADTTLILDNSASIRASPLLKDLQSEAAGYVAGKLAAEREPMDGIFLGAFAGGALTGPFVYFWWLYTRPDEPPHRGDEWKSSREYERAYDFAFKRTTKDRKRVSRVWGGTLGIATTAFFAWRFKVLGRQGR